MSEIFKYPKDIRDWPGTNMPDFLESAIHNALMEFSSISNRIFVRQLIERAYLYGYLTATRKANHD